MVYSRKKSSFAQVGDKGWVSFKRPLGSSELLIKSRAQAKPRSAFPLAETDRDPFSKSPSPFSATQKRASHDQLGYPSPHQHVTQPHTTFEALPLPHFQKPTPNNLNPIDKPPKSSSTSVTRQHRQNAGTYCLISHRIEFPSPVPAKFAILRS